MLIKYEHVNFMFMYYELQIIINAFFNEPVSA